jgi:beta-lactamase regulating signal transducer with metallopeptidase domain/type II secretory pathway component GspD/PulD (secretin)/uncharacterized GH25 family protein
MILQWLTSPAWANVVKALLHTLWQGAAGAVLLGFALRRLNHPVARYRCALAALGGVLLAGIVTWAVLNRPLPQSISTAPAPQTQPASVPLTQNTLPPLLVHFPPAEPKPAALPWSAWLALLWLAGATAMIFRAGFQVAGAERLRRSSRPLNDARMAALLDDARRAVGLARRVRLAVTDKLTSPAVVGVLLPTLILPLSLTTTLSQEQIRFVLLHELAHIRRGDYLASLFQLFAEALLFFNPAVWWISRQMRIEREACCDTLAIELSGAPVDYARTLVRVAENVLRPAPAAALAFGDKRGPSSLADRVQRLLVPGYRPALRLTWRAMLVALCVGGGLLFLSALGTRVTVAAVLSPQERIDRIEKKMTELGEKPVPENFAGNDANAPQVKISGQVHTADGTPVPKWVWMNIDSSVKHSSYGTAISAKNGSFTNSIRAGSILIGTDVTNFAPAFIGPLNGFATNRFENLEINLQRGFDVPLQLVDAENGQPVADAKIATMYWMFNQGFQPHFWKSGADGSVTLTHCADLPLDVAASAPGYETVKKRFDHVRAGEPLRVEMRRGVIESGVVLDKATGQPLAGAELHLIYQADLGKFEWNDPQQSLGKTDASGVFVLNQFRPGVHYSLGISAPGHESVFLDHVPGGKNDLSVRLGPELIVRGHVTGSLQGLQIIDKDYCLSRNYSESFGNQNYGSQEWVRLRVTNGVATFQFTNRASGPVTLTSETGYREERDVTEPISDWVVNLSEAHKTDAKFVPKREVVFHFQYPSGVPPRGTVEVTIPDSLDKKHLTAHMQEMQITNGGVRVEIAIGGQTSIESKRMVGYWFNRFGEWRSPTGEHGNLLAIEVTNGPSPLVIEIPLVPAGAIYAKARNADGTPAGGLMFGVSELKRAPDVDKSTLVGNDSDSFSDNAPRQWVSGPLPLGGTYQIHAWRGNSFCVSRPVKLTEANPDAEIELQFPAGKTFAGVVLDADGKPLHDAEVKVTFTLPVSRDDNHSFGLKSVFTDGRGQFHLEDLTPELGEYSVEIDAPGVLAEKVKLDFRSPPQTIRLQRGRTLAGRVIEAGTGYPIPGMEVRALDYEQNKLPMLATHTDAEGRFEFTTLGDVNYTLYPDGGELLPRPKSGNQKFRADGRTNLTLTVKLYEWSNLKPKAPVATVPTKTVMGILTDTNFLVTMRALHQQTGVESLAEPEVTTTSSGRGINRITMTNISVPITNFVSATSGQIPITFKLDRPIRFEELKIKLKDAGVNVPPTVIYYKDNGILFARGTKEQLARVNRLVLKLNGYSPEEIENAAKQFAERTGTLGTETVTETNLFQRTFKVDSLVFAQELRKQTGLPTNSVSMMARNFFSQLGVDWESPNGKAVFYGDRLGFLFVKATKADLDTIEQAIQSLNYTPQQIHIKARFYEVPKGTMRPNGILHGFQNFAPSNSAAHIIGILNATNAQAAFRALQDHSSWEILAEPEATTLSGRQTQMRVTQVVTVVTNLVFRDSFTNQDGVLVTNAIVPQTCKLETGPVLDVVPSVLADGCTINLALIPSLTEFLGYDQPTNTETAYTRTGKKISVPRILPRFNVRQGVASLNLWDGQTVVIGGLAASSISVTNHLVPVLGDIPVLGRLFQSQSRTNLENEVLVFVTATIIDPAGNRVHSDEELPFAKNGIPPQPPPPQK